MEGGEEGQDCVVGALFRVPSGFILLLSIAVPSQCISK